MTPPFNQCVFAATHNSYSGKARGSIHHQLDRGVRFLELDLNLRDDRYRIGHGAPGHEVDHDGNPGDDALASWLQCIADWSNAHREHLPITLAFDIKPDGARPTSFAKGNLAVLNAAMVDAFGRDRLFTPGDRQGDWPSADDIRGRIVWVLSGDGDRRRDYLSDGGRNPAVALGEDGAVVEVHASQRGELWYWTGTYADGRVTWHRHGLIGAGTSPAVALTDDGTAVLVSGGGEHGATWRTGTLLADGDIRWQEHATRLDLEAAAGDPAPVVRLRDDGKVRVTYAAGYGRRAFAAELDGTQAEPSAAAAGADAQMHRDHVVRGTDVVSVIAVPRTDGDGEMLLYGTGSTSSAPVQYEQLAFVEAQWVPNWGVAEEPGDRVFVATAAGSTESWAEPFRRGGRLVRLWDFGQSAADNTVNPNFPATNEPEADWYVNYLASREGFVTESS